MTALRGFLAGKDMVAEFVQVGGGIDAHLLFGEVAPLPGSNRTTTQADKQSTADKELGH